MTMEGRLFIGTLKGFDQKTNLILTGTKERVFSANTSAHDEAVGLFLLRGEAIASVGLSVDDHLIDFSEYKVLFATVLSSGRCILSMIRDRLRL